MKKSLNIRFVLLGTLVALTPIALGFGAFWFMLSRLAVDLPAGPTPMPVTPDAPAGLLPDGRIGLEQWVVYSESDIRGVGTGFFMQITPDLVLAVMTAHSMAIGQAAAVELRQPYGEQVWRLDQYYGEPGAGATNDNLTVDYVFLLPDQDTIDPNLVLQPDLRTAPEPGERIVVLCGFGNNTATTRCAEMGTVVAVQAEIIWVALDEHVNPGRMSGSPVLSAHTGQVVGMATIAAQRQNPLLIGLHPTPSLLTLARAARTPLPMLDNAR